MARRRKEERRVGIVSRGIVRQLGRFTSRVRHWVVPDRERVPDRCNTSGGSRGRLHDALACVQRAERAADGGVVDVGEHGDAGDYAASGISSTSISEYHRLNM